MTDTTGGSQVGQPSESLPVQLENPCVVDLVSSIEVSALVV